MTPSLRYSGERVGERGETANAEVIFRSFLSDRHGQPSVRPALILLIDNYDSFVYNLARYLRRLGQETHVVRNDAIDVLRVERLRPDAVVLSPGPCTPQEAGCSIGIVRQLAGVVPILGVCLGHQAIAAAWGGRILRAAEPRHGRSSEVVHEGQGLFAGLPSPLRAGRYHSLIVDQATLPECLTVTARTADGTIMAIQHREHPVFGLQFHPESVLTEHGYLLLSAFLRWAGRAVPPVVSGFQQDELRICRENPR
jgi:anthranilate synthase/aminodeoxychorismate synthase-like glutamine amidotransferase